MAEDFWAERWQAGQIGFHQTQINRYLQSHWDALEIERTAPVFVPLCGKSLDMHWLRQRGHPIIGIEVSALAVQAFFEEAALVPDVSKRGPLTVFDAAGYTLLCGDFFSLTSADLDSVGGAYDRAALIALPPDTRRAYAKALGDRLPDRTAMLLVTFEYDQQLMNGPPFAVHEEEVHALYEPAFTVDLLERSDASDLAQRFVDLGAGAIKEAVYRIRRG